MEVMFIQTSSMGFRKQQAFLVRMIDGAGDSFEWNLAAGMEKAGRFCCE